MEPVTRSHHTSSEGHTLSISNIVKDFRIKKVQDSNCFVYLIDGIKISSTWAADKYVIVFMKEYYFGAFSLVYYNFLIEVACD
jgi:hypothetical protein